MHTGDAVTISWREWHAAREELKEARRLLHLAHLAVHAGEPVDIGQIDGFLFGATKGASRKARKGRRPAMTRTTQRKP